MTGTNYDYESISMFRKQYKWLIFLYQLFYPFIIVCLILCLDKIIPNQIDTYGYVDSNNNFYYLFGLKNIFIAMIQILSFIVLFIAIPKIVEKKLKERYIEFLVAKHNGNIVFRKKRIKTIIISGIIILMTIASFSKINMITITNTSFVVNDNILYGSSREYTFDYFDSHKPYFSNMTNVAFYTINGQEGIQYDFPIGKYSKNLLIFLQKLDETTYFKYNIVDNFMTKGGVTKTKVTKGDD